MNAVDLQTESERERFWSKVRKGDGCWNWRASIQSLGYGNFWLRGKMVLSHRVAFTALKENIPDEMTLDHLCENRACCNPEHLQVVSLRENILRSNNPPAQNARKELCPRGHKYSAVKSGVRKGERYCKVCRAERLSSDHMKGINNG